MKRIVTTTLSVWPKSSMNLANKLTVGKRQCRLLSWLHLQPSVWSCASIKSDHRRSFKLRLRLFCLFHWYVVIYWRHRQFFLTLGSLLAIIRQMKCVFCHRIHEVYFLSFYLLSDTKILLVTKSLWLDSKDEWSLSGVKNTDGCRPGF